MREGSLYFDGEGAPLLKPSFCAFLDVLGFADETMAAFDAGNADDLFKRFYSVHVCQIREMSDRGSLRWWEVKVFTDNIVLGFPIWSGDGEGEFGSIMFTVGRYQYAMARAGFFVRGAMTAGQLFMDENTAFGPAIIDAYHLEQERARDPRIVLSDSIKRLVLAHMEYYGEPSESPQYREVIEDPDGVWFVNYLDQANVGEYEGEAMDWEGLAQHKEHIEANLKRFRSQPRIWSKYLWLANYHDWFVQLYEGVGGFTSEIRIDPCLIRTQPSRLVKE